MFCSCHSSIFFLLLVVFTGEEGGQDGGGAGDDDGGGGGYPRWTHIQFRWIQIFHLFYFYSFIIVFEDKPSAVLAS